MPSVLGRRRGSRRRWLVLTALTLATAGAVAASFWVRSQRPGAFVPPPGAQVLILGDSFTQGVGADHLDEGYASVLSRRLGWHATIDGVGGTGFTAGGPVDGRLHGAGQYARRVPTLAAAGIHPALVIVQGGQNDGAASPDRLERSEAATLSRIRTTWPDARLVVVGPCPPYPLSLKYTAVTETLKQGAARIGVPFVDPLDDQWFTADNSPRYAAADQHHPNTAGHAHLADELADALREARFAD